MKELGDWSEHDNKKYIGKIDRINVSMTEDYEVEYFIDHYLQSRNYSVSNKNRDIITKKLEAYPGKAPFKRDELNAYLDKLFNK